MDIDDVTMGNVECHGEDLATGYIRTTPSSMLSIPSPIVRLQSIYKHIMSGEAPILLLTAPTPNGHKVSVFLEELKLAYGIQYEYVPTPKPFYLALGDRINHRHRRVAACKPSTSGRTSRRSPGSSS